MLANLSAVKKVKLVNNKRCVGKWLKEKEQEKFGMVKVVFINSDFPCAGTFISQYSLAA